MVMRGAQVYLHKSDLKVSWLTVAAEERLSLQGLIVAFIRPQQGVARNGPRILDSLLSGFYSFNHAASCHTVSPK
ncbi:MAG: hypothetical protein KZQ72_12995, partial [Candidatus Thiodiazotropha sp. (ex Cardiolucina cf. quadrata)]|nr:hypothetical protein [Candidatus Thiodiazotropha sp. (ex Cardiolucina cf. quadrata)]